MRTDLRALVLGLALLATPAAQAGSALEQAYRQELQLLEAERKELQARIDSAEQDARDESARLRQAVTGLSEQVTELRLENEVLEERVGREEEVVAIGSDREALLDSTLDQALATLTRHGVELEEVEGDAAAWIPSLFERGLQLSERLGRLRVEPGRFFSEDGSERQAPILRVGQVAATALDPQAGGALAPAGVDMLEVLHPEPLAAARELAAGLRPTLVGLYLFDPLDRDARAARTERDLVQVFLAGGFVMWPILALALVALLILSERLVVLRRVHTNAGRLMREVGARISRGQWIRAAETCREERGAVSRVLEAILRHRELPRSQQEDLVNEAILAERPTLDRLLPALNVVAAVAPLLGLLGTVTGMISTFLVITEHGTGDPRLLSGGISEALLTTQFGLIVAIPALLAHAFLAGRVDHVLSDMETNALKLLNAMHCEHCGRLKEGTCVGAANGDSICPNLVGPTSGDTGDAVAHEEPAVGPRSPAPAELRAVVPEVVPGGSGGDDA